MFFFMFVLFRMHERDTVTEKDIDIAIQMTLEYVLAQRSKQSTRWTEKVVNISKYITKKFFWKNILAKTFFCHENKLLVNFFLQTLKSG